MTLSFEAATKAAVYASVLATIGTATAYWLVVPRAAGDDVRTGRADAERALARGGLIASLTAAGALMLRAWAHTAATFGFADALARASLTAVVIESRWGRSWQLQLACAIACSGAFAYVRASGGRRSAWLLASGAGIGLAIALTLTGHAAGAPPRMAIHVGHLLGGGVWLGTLAGLAAIRSRVSATFRTGLLRGFSPVALTGAAALAATGILAGWLYVGSFSNLTGTSYGQVLLLKLALVAGAAACGFVNWRSLQSGRAEPGRVVALELMLAVAIVLTTAVLTETEHP